MRKIYVFGISMLSAALFGCSSYPGTEATIPSFLVTQNLSSVQEECARFPALLHCVLISDESDVRPMSIASGQAPEALKCHGGERLKGAPVQWNDNVFTQGICGKVLLKKRAYGRGVTLYTAQFLISKTPSDPTLLAEVLPDNGSVRRLFEQALSTVPVDSQEASAYVNTTAQKYTLTQVENERVAEENRRIEAGRSACLDTDKVMLILEAEGRHESLRSVQSGFFQHADPKTLDTVASVYASGIPPWHAQNVADVLCPSPQERRDKKNPVSSPDFDRLPLRERIDAYEKYANPSPSGPIVPHKGCALGAVMVDGRFYQCVKSPEQTAADHARAEEMAKSNYEDFFHRMQNIPGICVGEECNHIRKIQRWDANGNMLN